MEMKKIINFFRKMEGYVGLNTAYANEIADFLEGYERRAENLVDYNADLNNQLNKAEVCIEMLEKQKEAMLKELCYKEDLVREAEGRSYELEKENENKDAHILKLCDNIKALENVIDENNKYFAEHSFNWISVEDERKPKEGESCIVRSSTDCITIRKYEKGGFPDNHRIRYWMHNPALPKPKEPTFKDVFLKAFPKAVIDKNGTPKSCIEGIFPWGKHHDCDGICCNRCWNQPYFEEEGGEE